MLQILLSDGIPVLLIFTWILLLCVAEALILISTAFCISLVKTSRFWIRNSNFWRQINKNQKREQISVFKSTHSHSEVTESGYQRPESALADKYIYCIHILVTWMKQANSLSNSLNAPKPQGLFHLRVCPCAFQMLATWGCNHDICCICVWVEAEGNMGCPLGNF